MKRFIALMLAVFMAAALLPPPFAAAQTSDPAGDFDFQCVQPRVNPVYAGIIDPSDLVFQEIPAPVAEDPQYGTEEDAVARIRECMKARMNSFTVYFRTTDSNASSLFTNLLNQAMDHTGDPKAGDSLRFQYGGYGGGISRFRSDGWIYCSFTYNISYYTSAEQEAELDLVIGDLLARLDLNHLSDYEKVRGVYDYICRNITYDYDHMNNYDYRLQYSAYGALVNGTAVCQGYAVLLYRLLLELGVDNRIVTGIGNGGPHAWNIVQLDGLYYNADSTWDAIWYQAGLDYEYFLRNEENFTEGGTDHFRDSAYDTEAFHSAYPMGDQDYEAAARITLAQGTCGKNLFWELRGDGSLVISGSGRMDDYYSTAGMPWWKYSGKVRSLVIGRDVTYIGCFAFVNLTNLSQATFLGPAPTIHDYAFMWSAAQCFYPDWETGWNSSTMKNYSGTLTWSPLKHYGLPDGVNGSEVPADRDFSLRIDADHRDFVAIYEEGMPVDPTCYAITSGSTVVTFTAEFLSSLEPGEHRFQVVFHDGITFITLIIRAPAAGAPGDLNGDDLVNSDDLTLLARHVAGIETVSGQALDNADVNGDGVVNSDDLTLHARFVAGIITGWDQV